MTETETITASDVIREVRLLASERPGFNYLSQRPNPSNTLGCSYIGRAVGDRTGEGCIVGQALVKAGVDFEKLAEVEIASGNLGVDGMLLRLKIESTSTERMWLRRVQRKQDLGDAWSTAVEYAEEM